ncbi:hypothetical protein, partial [Escherichia coli]|uniref:hypothetical protein n=1 Tax=Escherichia coli TaxID=562 RepID=UPI0022802CFF
GKSRIKKNPIYLSGLKKRGFPLRFYLFAGWGSVTQKPKVLVYYIHKWRLCDLINCETEKNRILHYKSIFYDL